MADSSKLLNYKQLAAKDIPDINLYMDQVITLIENTLDNYKKDEDQKLITKTMVNNYVKSEIIDKPIKKKYNKDQIMQLIMVYHLKNILNINDVDILLKYFMGQLEGSTEKLYEIFLSAQKEVFDELLENCGDDYDHSSEMKIHKKLKVLLTADINKRVLEEYIYSNINKKE